MNKSKEGVGSEGSRLIKLPVKPLVSVKADLNREQDTTLNTRFKDPERVTSLRRRAALTLDPVQCTP